MNLDGLRRDLLHRRWWQRDRDDGRCAICSDTAGQHPLMRNGGILLKRDGLFASDDSLHSMIFFMKRGNRIQRPLAQCGLLVTIGKRLPKITRPFAHAASKSQRCRRLIRALDHTLRSQDQRCHRRLKQRLRGHGLSVRICTRAGRLRCSIRWRETVGEFFATDHHSGDCCIFRPPPRPHHPAINDRFPIKATHRIVLTADHVALQGTVINLPPARVQTGKNVILAAARQRPHMLEAELLHPQPVRHQVTHLLIKHRQRHGRIVHQDAEWCLQDLGRLRGGGRRLKLPVIQGRGLRCRGPDG